MNGSYNIIDHHYDVIVIGAGGSGLRATLGCAEAGLKTACISKVFQLEVTLLLLKVELEQRSVTWEKIIGNGICTIQLRGLTG